MPGASPPEVTMPIFFIKNFDLSVYEASEEENKNLSKGGVMA
jgi:hypothetical protein